MKTARIFTTTANAMNPDLDTSFERFASAFVKVYWRVVKEGTFSLPPNEPVEESLEEILSAVSFTTEKKGIQNKSGNEYMFRMTGELGDWWLFGCNHSGRAWKLVSASARSDKKNSPHDLLGLVYGVYLRPMLEHVTNRANKDSYGRSG
ncbi:MAG: hypothetical protein ACK5JP_05120 [Akkermansiaceae bacterium]|jgi:hypothetical protein